MMSSQQKTKNPIEQLKLLRAFVGGGGGEQGQQQQHSEAHLTDCLRQCGYNVELAAEQLITGQYYLTAATATPMTGSGSGNTSSDNTKKRKGSTKSAFFQMMRNSNAAADQKTKKKRVHSMEATAQQQQLPQRKRKEPPTAAPRTAHKSNKIASNTAATVTPKTPLVGGGGAAAAAANHKNSTPTAVASSSSSSNGGDDGVLLLLLCRRWISDSIVTCRNCTVAHRESLTVEVGPTSVRFRGASVTGRLPEALAVLFLPFLVQPPKPAATATRWGRSLIRITAESLIHDDHLTTGSSLPIALAVYITSPVEFFDCMMGPNDGTATTPASQYFAAKAAATRIGNRKINRNLTQAEAAFLLLQWAEYGDVPEFKRPEDDDTGSKEIAKVDDEMMMPESGNSSSKNTSTHHERGQDSIDDIEMKEEDFEKDGALPSEQNDKQQQALAGSVVASNNPWSAQLPEAYDPVGFQDKHVSLRPYQKQALYFMLQREQAGESREEMEDQMQLLRDLSNEQCNSKSPTNGTGGSSTSPSFALDRTNGTAITCDCGPVLVVSDLAQTNSTSLDGTTHPPVHHHPLWRRRFLASPCMTKTVAFYVNELLGVATHRPPQPPRPCIGGILVCASFGLVCFALSGFLGTCLPLIGRFSSLTCHCRAMRWVWVSPSLACPSTVASSSFLTLFIRFAGKTVMLMALIMKSKEQRLLELKGNLALRRRWLWRNSRCWRSGKMKSRARPI
jgi:hypothetical protein